MTVYQALDLPVSTDLFADLTAEAWMDPGLTKAIDNDKASAIKAFARENGYEVPSAAEIDAFTLPASPIGDLRWDLGGQNIQAGTYDATCPTTSQPGCPSTNGTNCGPCSASFFPSDCTGGCYTPSCTSGWACGA
jgi:hypothetical protein